MALNRNLDPFSAKVEHFDLQDVLEKLEELPEIDGAWPKPSSLRRFDLTEMPYKMLRRFEIKVQPYDMDYVPDPNSIWSDFNEPCWLWTGGLHPKGYGRFWLGEAEGVRIWGYSHRISFEHWIGFPKPGYIVDHECNVKTCCNPVHLWPRSNADNLRLADERRPYKRRNQYSKE